MTLVPAGARIDGPRCEALVARAIEGDLVAWRALVEALWPHWLGMVRRSRTMGSYARSDDHVHDVLAALVDKLRHGGGLRHYPAWRERHPGKTFEDWARIVTANAIRDHVRHHQGSSDDRRASGEPSPKRLLNEFAASPAIESFGVRPPITDAQTAIQLVDFAEAHLPREQLGVLRLWLEGGDFEAIALERGLATPDDARRVLRAAIATIRRAFGQSPSPA